jgi:hypothetical protein
MVSQYVSKIKWHTLTNLLLHRISGDVDVGVEALGTQLLLDFLHIVVDCGHDGHHEHLARREPEWPATGEVLGENAVTLC